MITADTITDEQIRKLRSDLGSETYAGASDDAVECHLALLDHAGSRRQRDAARARCAEILNARSSRK